MKVAEVENTRLDKFACIRTVFFSHFQVMDVGFFQMYPLWLLATKDSGGLQWPVPKIGKVR